MVAYFFLRKKSLWSLLIRVWSIIVFRSLIAIGRLLGYGRLFLLPKNVIHFRIVDYSKYLPPFRGQNTPNRVTCFEDVDETILALDLIFLLKFHVL